MIVPLITVAVGWVAGWLVLGRLRRVQSSGAETVGTLSIIIPAE